MMAAPDPDRASILHRRALDRGPDRAIAAQVDDGAPPKDRRPTDDRDLGAYALPGAGMLAIALAGIMLGLSVTGLVLVRGWDPGAVTVGPWVARPRVGTPAIDPYAEAELARSGGVPLAANEGLRFAATTDDTGYRLLRSCSYRLAGSIPPARFWTLTATGADGDAMQAAARRSAFTSTTVVRDLAGRVTIELAPTARPGNWLPLAGQGSLTLTLRLYDTPLAGNAAEVATATLPSITRLSCAAPEARP